MSALLRKEDRKERMKKGRMEGRKGKSIFISLSQFGVICCLYLICFFPFPFFFRPSLLCELGVGLIILIEAVLTHQIMTPLINKLEQVDRYF